MTEVARQRASALAVYGAALTAPVFRGLTPAITKFVVAEVDPFTVGILRTVVAGPNCHVFALVIGLSLPKTASAWLLMGFSVLGCYIGFPVLFTLGRAETKNSHAALIIAIMPDLTGLFAALAERRMPVRGWWIGSSTAFLGVAFLVGARFGFGGSDDSLDGDLLCLDAAICGSAGYIAGSQLTAEIGTWATTFWDLTIACLFGGAAFLFGPDQTDWSTVSGFGYATPLYLAICGSILGYVTWYWALARGGTMRVASIQFLLPVIALAVAVFGLGEVMTLPLALSACAIVGGIFIAQRARQAHGKYKPRKNDYVGKQRTDYSRGAPDRTSYAADGATLLAAFIGALRHRSVGKA